MGLKIQNAVILLLCLMLVGLGVQYNTLKYNTAAIVGELADSELETETVRNKHVTVATALSKASEDNENLLRQIASMEIAINDLRFIVSSQGSVAGTTQVIEVPVHQPAPEHKYQLSNGLLLAELKVSLEGDLVKYSYPTYDLNVESTITLSDDKALVATYLSTSAQPDLKVLVDQKTKSFKIREQPLFEPHVLLLASLHAPVPALEAGLGVTFLHPSPDLDLVGARITASEKGASVGLDIGYYNLATHLPVLTNTWIGLGASIGTRGYAATLSVGGKL